MTEAVFDMFLLYEIQKFCSSHLCRLSSQRNGVGSLMEVGGITLKEWLLLTEISILEIPHALAFIE